jgi:hypothetical protein
MSRRSGAIAAAAVGTLLAGGIAIAGPAAAADGLFGSRPVTVTGDMTPFISTFNGETMADYSYQTTVVFRGKKAVRVTTTYFNCFNDVCEPGGSPSMWTDATEALDPEARRAINEQAGLDDLDYDDRGGAGGAEGAKPAILDMYRRSVTSALDKAGK